MPAVRGEGRHVRGADDMLLGHGVRLHGRGGEVLRVRRRRGGGGHYRTRTRRRTRLAAVGVAQDVLVGSGRSQVLRHDVERRERPVPPQLPDANGVRRFGRTVLRHLGLRREDGQPDVHERADAVAHRQRVAHAVAHHACADRPVDEGAHGDPARVLLRHVVGGRHVAVQEAVPGRGGSGVPGGRDVLRVHGMRGGEGVRRRSGRLDTGAR